MSDFPKVDNTVTLRAAPSRGISGNVDRENGIIYGLSVVTAGEARGHCVHLDTEFVENTVKLGNKAGKGIKSRFGHPNMSSSAVGTLLGSVKNFRVSDDGNKALADLHLSETAKSTPNGDLFHYVLDLAENDPDKFGTSIVFERGKVYRRKQDGKKVYRYVERDGRPVFNEAYNDAPAPDYIEIARLRADDIVDEPAANPSGIFSAFSEQQPAAIVTRFLDENPEIWELLQEDDIDTIFEAFRERYRAYKGEPAPQAPNPETHKKEPAMETNDIVRYDEAFGAEKAMSYLKAGLDFDEAQKRFKADQAEDEKRQLQEQMQSLSTANEELTKQLAEAGSEIESLKAQVEELKAGEEPAPAGGESPDGASKKLNAAEMAKQLVAKENISLREAFSRIYREHPELKV
jgi:hypothetical protein